MHFFPIGKCNLSRGVMIRDWESIDIRLKFLPGGGGVENLCRPEYSRVRVELRGHRFNREAH